MKIHPMKKAYMLSKVPRLLILSYSLSCNLKNERASPLKKKKEIKTHIFRFLDLQTIYPEIYLFGIFRESDLTLPLRENCSTRMQKGLTPFHLAAYRGNLEICKLFIETLDDINPKGIYDRLPVINNPIFELDFMFFCCLISNEQTRD